MSEPYLGSSAAFTAFAATAAAANTSGLAPPLPAPCPAPPGPLRHQYPWVSVDVEHLPTQVRCTPAPGALVSYTGTWSYLFDRGERGRERERGGGEREGREKEGRESEKERRRGDRERERE